MCKYVKFPDTLIIDIISPSELNLFEHILSSPELYLFEHIVTQVTMS